MAPIDGERAIGDRIARTGRHAPVRAARLYPAWLARPWVAVLLLLANCAYSVADQWLERYEPVRTATLVLGLLGDFGLILGLTMIWAGIWTLVSRLWRGTAVFWVHTSLLLAATLGSELLESCFENGTYALGLDDAVRLLWWTPLYAALFAWLLAGALFHAARRPSRRLLATGAAIAVGIVGVAATAIELSHQQGGDADQRAPRVRCAALRLARPASAATHVQALDRLEPLVAADARELANELDRSGR